MTLIDEVIKWLLVGGGLLTIVGLYVSLAIKISRMEDIKCDKDQVNKLIDEKLALHFLEIKNRLDSLNSDAITTRAIIVSIADQVKANIPRMPIKS